MSIGYLDNKPWSRWTREERYFCSVLFHHAAPDPSGFARWIIDVTGLSTSPEGEWDLGYEVCLYRDYLWHKGRSARGEKLPFKRTFDLCIFGEQSLIIVEAKAHEGFEAKQNENFREDRRLLPRLMNVPEDGVKLIALATSHYLDKCTPELLAPFDGRLSWAAVHDRFSDEAFELADGLYKTQAVRGVG